MATAATVFRDYETDGVPGSGAHKVKKPDVRQLLAGYEAIINAFLTNGGLIFASKASLDSSLNYAANTMAWVLGDTTVANNGIYRKIGASGTGSWTRVSDLPFSFIIASDVGAGTANAIQATTSIPVSQSALIWTNIFETNTASPVTISFNGGVALTVKTNSGNNPSPAGGLQAGMIVLGIVQGSIFRLVSDQTSASLLAQVEAVVAGIDVGAFATAAQGAKADTAVQRTGNETKTGDLRITDGLLRVSKNLQIIPSDVDGMVISNNRSAGDGETNIRNMFVNSYGPSKAFVFSQVTAVGVSEVDLLTMHRNGQIKMGGSGWLEPLAGQTETISALTVLSKPGLGMPLTVGVKTSHLTAPAYMAGQAIIAFGYNDRARTGDFNTTFLAWGAYFEARRDPGSGRAHGFESGTVNLHNGTDAATTATPYAYANENFIVSGWHSAGRPDVGTGQRDIDVAEGFIQNGPSGLQVSYKVGLLFGDKSIREVSGVAPVMRMPTKYQIEWWIPAGLSAYIRSEQSGSANPVGIVMRNSTIDFEHNGALSVGISATGIRTPATNGGYDTNAVYIGSTTATQQYQLQTSSTALFLNRNTGSTGSPTWSAIGNWNATTGAYTSVSDETLKQDFREFDRDIPKLIAGLAEASSFYRMKSAPQTEYFGFLAQRLRAVLPEAIHEIKQTESVHKARSILHVEDRPIIAALAVAVEHLNKQLEKLENTA